MTDNVDVLIIGGAIMGSSLAWWLTRDPGFGGRVVVIERDPSYAYAATSLSHSSIRQQFGQAINVRISQFGAAFLRDIRDWMGPEAPPIPIRSDGYLYLADTPAFADALRQAQALQAGLGAATRLLGPDQAAAEWPYLCFDGIALASHNPVDEGAFDGIALFDLFRRQARAQGAHYVTGEVAGLTRDRDRITAATLTDGTSYAPGIVVNCAGTRGAQVANMAGLSLPVEPRARFSYVFDAAEPLPGPLPLTIDPAGVHVRPEGGGFLAGYVPRPDLPRDPEDFTIDHAVWEDAVWPILATRIPAFERIRLRRTWVGHYDYNRLDRNAVLGPHPEVANFLFCNGFSGHGLQQSPAIGRGLAEWIVDGGWRTLDLSGLGYERVALNRPLIERAVI